MSFNVRGINETVKGRQIFNFICDKNPDLVLLQETHLVKAKEKLRRNEWGGDIFYSHGQSNAEIFKIVEISDSPHGIITGDFNLCFDINLDKRGTVYNNTRALQVLNEYMEENYMSDVWRIRNPDKFSFT